MARAPMGKPKKRKSRRNAETKFRGPVVKIEDVNWKDVGVLQKLTSAQGKIFSRKRTGLTAAGQRELTRAIKHARFMALLPFVS